MAYDRYDENRRGGPGRSSDSRYGDDQHRGRGGEDRGFFERAGEQVRSWFGDDDDHERGGMDRDRSRSHGQGRDEGDRPGWGPALNWGRDREDRPSGRGSHSEMSRGGQRSDRDNDGQGRSHGGFDRAHRNDEDDRSGAPRGGGSGYRPMAGDYGRAGGGRGDADQDSQWNRDPYRRSSFVGSTEQSNHDPHYDEWRRRQMDELDRDYHEYRREHQSKFESEFGGWREKRQQKRQMAGQVSEHMEVVGSDGEHVGTVDCVAGDRLILTKSDEAAGGKHHSLSCHDVERIEDNRVVLSHKADDARKRWRKEGHERALFEREDQGEDGPHMLDRSFSGTYR
ncbi:MAG: DUF2171 domain-containing protein [Pseudomonadota bacterium]|nr:DUF2171 domain-containing protein [Pseudomonadota bacterium]